MREFYSSSSSLLLSFQRTIPYGKIRLASDRAKVFFDESARDDSLLETCSHGLKGVEGQFLYFAISCGVRFLGSRWVEGGACSPDEAERIRRHRTWPPQKVPFFVPGEVLYAKMRSIVFSTADARFLSRKKQQTTSAEMFHLRVSLQAGRRPEPGVMKIIRFSV